MSELAIAIASIEERLVELGHNVGRRTGKSRPHVNLPLAGDHTSAK